MIIMDIPNTPCPLCRHNNPALFHADTHRRYYRCSRCSLIFVPAEQYLCADKEKAIYDYHQNSVEDDGYRRFLSRMAEPIQQYLPVGSQGLDFGCGPEPVLSMMLKQQGYHMSVYDKYYLPDESVFNTQYDFITATEVIEHLHRPAIELERLWQCLKPGGVLGIMTKLALDEKAFARWHYKNDMTHVCIYSTDCFDWLANQWQTQVEYIGKDVALFIKSE